MRIHYKDGTSDLLASPVEFSVFSDKDAYRKERSRLSGTDFRTSYPSFVIDPFETNGECTLLNNMIEPNYRFSHLDRVNFYPIGLLIFRTVKSTKKSKYVYPEDVSHFSLDISNTSDYMDSGEEKALHTFVTTTLNSAGNNESYSDTVGYFGKFPSLLYRTMYLHHEREGLDVSPWMSLNKITGLCLYSPAYALSSVDVEQELRNYYGYNYLKGSHYLGDGYVVAFNFDNSPVDTFAVYIKENRASKSVRDVVSFEVTVGKFDYNNRIFKPSTVGTIVVDETFDVFSYWYNTLLDLHGVVAHVVSSRKKSLMDKSAYRGFYEGMVIY